MSIVPHCSCSETRGAITATKDFEANGEAAIERCRNDDPAAYLRLVASLEPEKVNVGGEVTLLDYCAALAAEDAEAALGEEEDEPAPVRH